MKLTDRFLVCPICRETDGEPWQGWGHTGRCAGSVVRGTVHAPRKMVVATMRRERLAR